MDINCFKFDGTTIWALIYLNLMGLPYGHYCIQIWLSYHMSTNLFKFGGRGYHMELFYSNLVGLPQGN